MSIGNQTLFGNLRQLAESLHIDIREEAMEEGRGGIYLLGGRRHLLINSLLPVEAKVDLLIEALKKEDLSGVFVLPALREVLEN